MSKVHTVGKFCPVSNQRYHIWY